MQSTCIDRGSSFRAAPAAPLPTTLRSEALRVAVGPDVELVEVDGVDAVGRQGAGDLGTVLDRVVDGLADDGRAHPALATWIRRRARPIRNGGLDADPGIVGCAASRDLGELGHRRR